MRAKTYTCDDCGARAEFTSYKLARTAGWGIAKDYTTCYCPNCAPLHRRGKATEKNIETAAALPEGWEQLKLI